MTRDTTRVLAASSVKHCLIVKNPPKPPAGHLAHFVYVFFRGQSRVKNNTKVSYTFHKWHNTGTYFYGWWQVFVRAGGGYKYKKNFGFILVQLYQFVLDHPALYVICAMLNALNSTVDVA